MTQDFDSVGKILCVHKNISKEEHEQIQRNKKNQSFYSIWILLPMAKSQIL